MALSRFFRFHFPADGETLGGFYFIILKGAPENSFLSISQAPGGGDLGGELLPCVQVPSDKVTLFPSWIQGSPLWICHHLTLN